MRFISHKAEETRALGQKLTRNFLKKRSPRKALIISCEGELGTGKTTFIQGVARGFGIKEQIKSPTFVILRQHRLPQEVAGFETFYHLDCYRLKGARDILNLGFKDLICDPKNVIVIEWANRIKKCLPAESLRVKFRHLGNQKREIRIK